MHDFPVFMKSAKNAIDPASQSRGVEGYVFDGADGSQMAIWTCHVDGLSAEHAHEYDEYFTVVQGKYTVIVNQNEIEVTPGMEYVIPKRVPHSGKFLTGTRTIHAFGGIRAKRLGSYSRSG